MTPLSRSTALREARKTVAEIQIKVDTGLGRYGFLPTEMDKVASIFKYMSSLAIIGMFTTYAASATNRKLTEQQYNLFNEVLDRISDMGFEPGVAHICDSARCFGMISGGWTQFGSIPA